MKLEYGLRNDTQQLAHISEVDRGDACNCLCPACNSPLRAKKGRVVTHHFAHVNAECEHAIESALHLAAKEVLAQCQKIWLPALAYQRQWLPDIDSSEPYRENEHIVLFQAQSVPLSNIRLEHYFGGVVPDLMATYRGTEIMIEIAVTHFIDEIKRQKIEALGIATVEINLSPLDRMPDREQLLKLLTEENPHSRWIYSPKRAKAVAIETQRREAHSRKLHERLKEKDAQEQRKLDILFSEMRSRMHPEAIKARKAAWRTSETVRERLLVLSKIVGCNVDEFPTILNQPVAGEEAFDCDRRLWQAAFYYAFFIYKNGYLQTFPFRVKDALNWIKKNVQEAKIPFCISRISYLARDLGHGMKAELVLSAADRALLPDAYKAVELYMQHLVEANLLEHLGGSEYRRTGKLIAS